MDKSLRPPPAPTIALLTFSAPVGRREQPVDRQFHQAPAHAAPRI